MRRRVAVLVACALLSSPRLARADEVLLKNGEVIRNVKVTRVGTDFRLARLHGSSLIPGDEVASVAIKPTISDELAERKLKAGTDPVALRALARWCNDQDIDLSVERNDLLALAHGIELDRKLEAIGRPKTGRPFVDLARQMKADKSYVASEVHLVLEKALAIDPEDADARFELGQVKRDGAWVTIAEARMIDDAREAKVMAARGLVKFEGCWITPRTKERILERRAREARLAEAQAEQAQQAQQAQPAQQAPDDAAASTATSDDTETSQQQDVQGGVDPNGTPYYDWVNGGWVVIDRDHRRDDYRSAANPGRSTTVLSGPSPSGRPVVPARPAAPTPPAHVSAPSRPVAPAPAPEAPRHETPRYEPPRTAPSRNEPSQSQGSGSSGSSGHR